MLILQIASDGEHKITCFSRTVSKTGAIVSEQEHLNNPATGHSPSHNWHRPLVAITLDCFYLHFFEADQLEVIILPPFQYAFLKMAQTTGSK